MFKVAKSFEYAVLALKYIAEHQNGEIVSTKKISENVDIPYDLLAKIMQRLVKNGIISSTQGTKGGYTMNTQPDKISLNEILVSVEQSIQVTDCMVINPTKEHCKRVNDCCLRSPMNVIQNKITDIFNTTTLHEVIK